GAVWGRDVPGRGAGPALRVRRDARQGEVRVAGFDRPGSGMKASCVRVLSALGLAAACGGAPPAPPVMPPARVVSLAPSITEIVYALGAADRLVGVCAQCNYPEAAAQLPRVGGYLVPNVEAVVAARPDLVLVVPSPGNRDAVHAVERTGIRVVVVQDRTLEDLWTSMRTVAAALAPRAWRPCRRCATDASSRSPATPSSGRARASRRRRARSPPPSIPRRSQPVDPPGAVPERSPPRGDRRRADGTPRPVDRRGDADRTGADEPRAGARGAGGHRPPDPVRDPAAAHRARRRRRRQPRGVGGGAPGAARESARVPAPPRDLGRRRRRRRDRADCRRGGDL